MRPRVFLASYYNRELIKPALAGLEKVAEVYFPEYQGRNFTEAELIESLPGFDAVIAADEHYTNAVFEAARQLKIVARDGMGVDGIDIKAATAHGVLIANAPVVHNSTANLAMGLIVCLVRRILIGDRGVRAGRWTEREEFLCPDLDGKILGLVGYGKVGQAVARRALAFNLRVEAYDPAPNLADAPEGVEMTTLEDLLARADIVSLHAPLTPQTHHLIRAETLRLMKRGAYLVNTGRGRLIDDQALVEALRSGHLAGAALDVFAQEPPAPGHPLLKMDNVVLTPHVGGDTTDTMYKAIEVASQNIMDWFQGRPPTNLLNPEALEAAWARLQR